MHLVHNINPTRSYTLNGRQIKSVNEEKDLGIYLSSDCKLSLQCTKAAAKAMQSLRIIKRTFNYIDKDGFAIRPYLEYCVQAWYHNQQKDIEYLKNMHGRHPNWSPA